MGTFFVDSEFRTRVLVLDQDEKELHESNDAARHLADRHDLRFGFVSDMQVMKRYDDEKHYLTENLNHGKGPMGGAFEALVVYNHVTSSIAYGLHGHHNFNQEMNIREFVNRESVATMDDYNADTAITFGMVDEPLFITFVDLDRYKYDEEAGR